MLKFYMLVGMQIKCLQIFLSYMIYHCILFKSRYAIKDGNKIKIFKNFKEKKSFKPEYGAESKSPLIFFYSNIIFCPSLYTHNL